MAKKIATKVNYQVTELVNNLNEAATTISEQKRDFYTTKALYNAKRLSSTALHQFCHYIDIGKSTVVVVIYY